MLSQADLVEVHRCRGESERRSCEKQPAFEGQNGSEGAGVGDGSAMLCFSATLTEGVEAGASGKPRCDYRSKEDTALYSVMRRNLRRSLPEGMGCSPLSTEASCEQEECYRSCRRYREKSTNDDDKALCTIRAIPSHVGRRNTICRSSASHKRTDWVVEEPFFPR